MHCLLFGSVPEARRPLPAVGHLPVAARLSAGDLLQKLPDLALELRPLGGEAELEAREPAREVGGELPGGLSERLVVPWRDEVRT